VALQELMITFAIAGGTAVLQIIMKGSSRTNLPNKRHGLTSDDVLFWSDWTIAGVFALSGSVIAGATQGKPTTGIVTPLIFGYGAIVLGFVALPFFLRTFAYDPGAKIRKLGWKGSGWIVIANLFGIAILLCAVVAGVKVYEWD